MKTILMEADSFTKFVKGKLFLNLVFKNKYFKILKTLNLKENPHLFLHPDLSLEDRDTLENIFLYKEKLLSEIKELEDELAEVQFEIEQIDISENEK